MFVRSAYKEVEARLQEIINHVDARFSRRTDLQEDYHRWREAAVTNSAKLQRWVNAERSWSIFITRTLCARLDADLALLVDKFLFGSWHPEESEMDEEEEEEEEAEEDCRLS